MGITEDVIETQPLKIEIVTEISHLTIGLMDVQETMTTQVQVVTTSQQGIKMKQHWKIKWGEARGILNDKQG